MADGLPKVDRARLRERLLAEFERVVEEVSDAIDDAPAGRVIRDSEEKSRDSLDRFRQIVYEEGLQAKIDAAEAAFPPPTSAATGKPKRHKGRQAQERIALVDGAPWIRNQFEFHGLVDDIGLDFYHLQENAQKARRGVFGEESEDGRNWVAELMHTFKHDGCDTAWDSMTTLRSPLRSPRKRAAANRLMQYVAERREMIRYPEFRAKSWQIGSGPTEAECKTTTHRVKNRGRRCDTDNAEAMMALAALHDSRLWHQRWTTLDSQKN